MQTEAIQNPEVSAFYSDVRKTDKGVHVGFVCDAGSHICAAVSVLVWSRLKYGTEPNDLVDIVFNPGA